MKLKNPTPPPGTVLPLTEEDLLVNAMLVAEGSSRDEFVVVTDSPMFASVLGQVIGKPSPSFPPGMPYFVWARLPRTVVRGVVQCLVGNGPEVFEVCGKVGNAAYRAVVVRMQGHELTIRFAGDAAKRRPHASS